MTGGFSYDAIAERYAARVDTAPYNALYERPAMLALLPEVRGARVLDAGCGSGWYAERLLERGARVTAVDASAAMAAHARARLGGRAEVRVADLRDPLEFAGEGAFDGVLSALALHYLRDWGPTLAELHRVLAPGGWLLLSTHHPAADAARFAARYDEVEEVADHWEGVGEVRFFRRPLSAITGALLDAGFTLRRVVEPVPGEAFRAARPDAHARLVRQPEFILFLARRT